jgi:MFS family permease
MALSSQKRNTILLWLAQMISTAGDAIYQLALIWLVLDITGSSTITGLIAMSAYLPAMLFGLYAGVLSDRHNRIAIIIFANLIQALTVIIIPILILNQYENIVVIGSLAFIRACFSTLFPPAFNAFIPTIVEKKHLVRVNSILSSSAQLAYLIGPASAGILLGIISLPYLFIIDASSFIVAVLLFTLIIKPPQPIRSTVKHSGLKELMLGIKYIMNNKPLGQLLLLTSINNVFIMGLAIVGTPILVRNALNGTASQYAFVESGLAFGMLLGSVLIFKFGHLVNNGKILLIGMVLDGLTYSLFYMAQSISFVLVFIVVHALGIPFITISRTTIIQKYVPNEYHGRLFSMVHLSVVGITALASALVGIFAEFIDIRTIFLWSGLGAALCGVWGFSKAHLRDLK